MQKNLPKLLATAKRNLKRDRKNIRSTKPSISPSPIVLPSQHEPPVRSHQVFFETIKLTGTVSTDQTGRFSVTSSRDSKYLMVIYDHDSNAITPELIKLWSSSELIQAYAVLHSKLTNRGLQPNFQILDNECTSGLKHYILREGVTFQRVPPRLHQTNSAERAIQTFKYHPISGISSCDPGFPLHLWDQLLSQATLTLNLLQPSKINPRLSAESQINGAFDFNQTPLVPSGTKALIFESSADRRTWSPHGVDGWYLGPAPKQYRCYQLYVPKTRAERTAKTAHFFCTNVQCRKPPPSTQPLSQRVP